MGSEGGRKHILIVDDDPNIRRFITESLRLRGYEVESFAAAEEALQELEKHHFDLALLDILLPGTNGLQLCRKLKSLPKTKHLPVIMMTAFYKQTEHINDARDEYGATDYLLKPFPLQTLHEKIDTLIGGPEAAPGAERLSIGGQLNETGLPRILHNLYSLRATGLLHLENHGVKKVVYIRDGYPIFVRSNLVNEFLGQILLRNGQLNEAELKSSVEVARGKGQRHGTALIEMGLITPQQLDDGLHCQAREKLLEIFSWSDGSYRFIQAREFKQGVTSINLSTANLILQGLREHAGREQLLKILDPHYDHYLQQAENPLYRFQEIQLTAMEQRILDRCQGQTTLREILKRHALSRKEAEPLLAALLSTGILIGHGEPTAVPGEPVGGNVEDRHSRRQNFLKDYAWMMEQDFFTLLGVSESDSREQVRRSYHNLAKTYHPDRFFEQDGLHDLQDKVNKLFQRISDAHETLSDTSARARYISDRSGRGKTTGTTTNLETILQAENAFQMGKAFFRTRRYADARQAFTEALGFNPNEAEYLMFRAWSAYKADPLATETAISSRRDLVRAIELNPRLSLAHLYLGYLSRDEGNHKEAQRRFEQAIKCDPNCTDAQRELRLMNMRKATAKKEKKGLFGKMFN